MFGLFKKKNYTQELSEMLLLQNDIMKDLISVLRLKCVPCLAKETRNDVAPDKLCGEWICKDIGISIKMSKQKNDYRVCLGNLHDLSFNDNQKSYPIRKYKNLFYFVLNGYAIFIEYAEDENKIYLEGKLVLTNKESPTKEFIETF